MRYCIQDPWVQAADMACLNYTGVVHQAWLPSSHVLLLLVFDDNCTYTGRIELTTSGGRQEYARIRRSLLSLDPAFEQLKERVGDRSCWSLRRCVVELAKDVKHDLDGRNAGFCTWERYLQGFVEGSRNISCSTFPCTSSIC